MSGPKNLIINQRNPFAGTAGSNELKTFQVCPTLRHWQYLVLLILFFA